MTGKTGVFILLYVCYASLTSSDVDNQVCHKDENGVNCDKIDVTLTRLDGGDVGSTREVVLADGTKLKLKTLSKKPVLFEVPNFLSKEECDHFRSLANDMGMESSRTHSNKIRPTIHLLDINQDQKLSLSEMRFTIEEAFDVYPHEEDILKMYSETGLDADNDGIITKDEMKNFTPNDLKKYVKSFVKKQPEKHSRFSSQVFINPHNTTDEVFKIVQKRVSELVSLPMELIKLSDFQVVQYGVKGHYNAHFDSHQVHTKIKCCVGFLKKKCRICRYMTILFYLNDVEDGGETAFPMADNETYNETLRLERRNLFRSNCDGSFLRVLPSKGKAVVWYNHFKDPTTQWLGELDEYSIHGGCPVKKGEKWIANFWIKLEDDKDKTIKLMKKFT